MIRHLLMVLALVPALALAEQGTPRASGELTLSTSVVAEVTNDWITLAFSVTRDGANATTVQNELKRAVDTALTEARKVAKAGQIELRTGTLSVQPRYGDFGKPAGWTGYAQLIVEGRDITGIAQLSGRINSMVIAQVTYGLSRETREKAEAEVAARAIAAFRKKADAFAKEFGYVDAYVRSVDVSSDSANPQPYAVRAMASKADSPPLPTEPGKGTVTVTVSGTVQMKARY